MKERYQHCQPSTPVDATCHRVRRQPKSIWKTRSGEGDADSKIQVQMEAAAQNRAEGGEEWSVAYVPRATTRKNERVWQ